MFAEVDRLESDATAASRRSSRGVRQVEGFIEQGDWRKAELALKILLQMDPENRHRKRLEKAIKALQRG